MRREEERGHGSFYGEIGTKTVFPRFQGAEQKKNGPFLHIAVLWAALLLPSLHAMSDRGLEQVGRGGGRTATSQGMKSLGKVGVIL